MNPLTPCERKEMIEGLEEFIGIIDQYLETADEMMELQHEITAREAQEELNAEYIAVIEGREPAA